MRIETGGWACWLVRELRSMYVEKSAGGRQFAKEAPRKQHNFIFSIHSENEAHTHNSNCFRNGNGIKAPSEFKVSSNQSLANGHTTSKPFTENDLQFYARQQNRNSKSYRLWETYKHREHSGIGENKNMWKQEQKLKKKRAHTQNVYSSENMCMVCFSLVRSYKFIH